MNRFRKSGKGFTMIELMVVVIIVGVLAAIAIPLYGKYVKNARVTEATGRIGEIITACKAWAQENQDDATGIAQWPTNAQFQVGNGILDATATENFQYQINAAGDATATPLVVTATGQNRMNGVVITVTVPDIGSTGQPPVIVGM